VRGVKEAINVKLEKTSLNRGGGLWYHVAALLQLSSPGGFTTIHTLDLETKTCFFRQINNTQVRMT